MWRFYEVYEELFAPWLRLDKRVQNTSPNPDPDRVGKIKSG